MIVADAGDLVPHLGHGRRRRARRRHPRHRLRRALRPGRGPGPHPAHRPRRRGEIAARSPGDRRRDLRLHERPRSRSRSSEWPSSCPRVREDRGRRSPTPSSRRGRSWPSSTSTSSARTRPRRPWPSPCATASAAAASRPTLADEITPKNILMIGPTGVGKTEISRRLAKLTSSPFLKIEASKFTEVGYVGRDVESIIRDLVRMSVDMVRQEKIGRDRGQGRGRTSRRSSSTCSCRRPASARRAPTEEEYQSLFETREKFRQQLRDGLLEDRIVEIEVKDKPRRPHRDLLQLRASRRSASRSRRSCPGSWAARPRGARSRSTRPASSSWTRRRSASIDMDQVARLAIERVEQLRHRLPRRAGQDRRPGGGPRPRGQPRGRPARPPADRRGDDRPHPLRPGQDRPHPVHRGRGLQRGQAVRPHPRAAGPLPDPGRAAVARSRTTSSAS